MVITRTIQDNAADAVSNVSLALRDIADDLVTVKAAAPAALTAGAPAAATATTLASITSTQNGTTGASAPSGSYVQAEAVTAANLANALKVSYNAAQADVSTLQTKYNALLVDFTDLRTKYTALLADVTAIRTSVATVGAGTLLTTKG